MNNNNFSSNSSSNSDDDSTNSSDNELAQDREKEPLTEDEKASKKIWKAVFAEDEPSLNSLLAALPAEQRDIIEWEHPEFSKEDEAYKGKTPFMYACFHGSLSIALSLLNKGALPEGQDERGNTALHLLCFGILKKNVTPVSPEERNTFRQIVFKIGEYANTSVIIDRINRHRQSYKDLTKSSRGFPLTQQQTSLFTTLKNQLKQGQKAFAVRMENMSAVPNGSSANLPPLSACAPQFAPFTPQVSSYLPSTPATVPTPLSTTAPLSIPTFGNHVATYGTAVFQPQPGLSLRVITPPDLSSTTTSVTPTDLPKPPI